MERLAVTRIGEMRMTINQSGQHRHFREIDHRCPRRNGQILTNRFNLVAAHQEHLIHQHSAGIHVHKFSGTNNGNLRNRKCLLAGRNSCGNDQQQNKTGGSRKHGVLSWGCGMQTRL